MMKFNCLRAAHLICPITNSGFFLLLSVLPFIRMDAKNERVQFIIARETTIAGMFNAVAVQFSVCVWSLGVQ